MGSCCVRWCRSPTAARAACSRASCRCRLGSRTQGDATPRSAAHSTGCAPPAAPARQPSCSSGEGLAAASVLGAAARLAVGHHAFNVAIANIPGPQTPLSAARTRAARRLSRAAAAAKPGAQRRRGQLRRQAVLRAAGRLRRGRRPRPAGGGAGGVAAGAAEGPTEARRLRAGLSRPARGASARPPPARPHAGRRHGCSGGSRRRDP